MDAVVPTSDTARPARKPEPMPLPKFPSDGLGIRIARFQAYWAELPANARGSVWMILSSLTFAVMATGIKLIGAFLLFAVCYEMWRDLIKGQAPSEELIEKEAEVADGIEDAIEHVIGEEHPSPGTESAAVKGGALASLSSPEFRRAMLKIIVADVSMSLDNVLAVAGVARENVGMLVFGLVLSIALMALGATLVAKLLDRHRWLGYVGLLIILYVAVDMGIDGWREVSAALNI